MNRKTLTIIGLLSLTACGGTLKPEYQIVESSTGRTSRPDWIIRDEPCIGQAGKRECLGEATHFKKDLCMKGASTRASILIGKEKKHNISEEYESVSTDDSDSTSSKESSSMSEVQEGTKHGKSYWEKRLYPNGSAEYACFQLISK
jgi:hypothetical protein